MSSMRATLAAATASLGVLALGWSVATANGGTVAIPTPGSGNAPTTGTTRTTTTTGSTGATGATAPARGTTSQAAASATTTYTDGTYTGSATTFRFGTVTVTATISNGRITAVTERLVSDGQGKSNQINARSVPALKSAIVAANSAKVSTISGATYTTRAYLTSLQSALDQASR